MTQYEHFQPVGGAGYTVRTGEIGGVEYRATRYDDGPPGDIVTLPEATAEHVEVAKKLFGEVEFVIDEEGEPVPIAEFAQTIAGLGITLQDLDRGEEDYDA